MNSLLVFFLLADVANDCYFHFHDYKALILKAEDMRGLMKVANKSNGLLQTFVSDFDGADVWISNLESGDAELEALSRQKLEELRTQMNERSGLLYIESGPASDSLSDIAAYEYADKVEVDDINLRPRLERAIEEYDSRVNDGIEEISLA